MKSIKFRALLGPVAIVFSSMSLITACGQVDAPAVDSVSKINAVAEELSAPDQSMGAGILNNEVPEAFKIETLVAMSNASIGAFGGSWTGHSLRAGEDFEKTTPHSFHIVVEGSDEEITSITVTNQFGDVSQAKDIKFSENVLTFEFLSGVENALGEPFRQFAELVVVEESIRGLLRLRLDDREQFDMSVKEILRLERESK